MKKKKIYSSTLMSMFTLAWTTSIWSAVPIAINNPGFEDDILGAGETQSTPVGWADGYYALSSPTAWVAGDACSGVVNPDIADFGGVAPEGNNVMYAGIYDGYEMGLNQVLTDVLQPNAEYTLSVKVGNPKGINADDFTADYRIELLAGGIVQDFAIGLSPDPDEWETVSFTFASGDAPPEVAQALEIRLLAGPLAGVQCGPEVHYDDVSLTVTFSAPVVDTGGPYFVSPGESLHLDGSGSTPAPDTSITDYDWDLDGGGTDVTGAMPAGIPYEDLISMYGMVVGPGNTITLTVTDDAAGSATVPTTVKLTPAGEPATIVNASFEDPALSDGDYTWNDTPTIGWSQGNYAAGDPGVWIPESVPGATRGVWNPDTTAYPSSAAADGQNTSWNESAIGMAMGINQILSGHLGTVQADATYNLVVAVGNPNTYNEGLGPDFRIELLANGTVLTSTGDASPTDNFEYHTLSYSAGATPAQLGQSLEIRLITEDDSLDAAHILDFDDAALYTILAHPIADAGGYYVPEATSLSLDGSASLPSDNDAITLYEWDLNNDGTFDVTGLTPAAIPDTELTATWGMIPGPNTIQLRVTDSTGTHTAPSTVALPAAQDGTWVSTVGGTWTDPVNWDAGFANGPNFTAFFHTSFLADSTVNFSFPETLGNLEYHASNTITLTGNPLTLEVTTGSPLFDIQNGTVDATNEIASTAGLTKNGPGALLLSNPMNSITGAIALNGGTLGWNASDTGIPASGVTAAPGSTALSLEAIDNAFLNKINPASNGEFLIGMNVASTNDLDFNTAAGAILPMASLSAMSGNLTMDGIITPHNGTYRIGGGGGFLSITTLDPANSLVVSGPGGLNHQGNLTFPGVTLRNGAKIQDLLLGSHTSPITLEAGVNTIDSSQQTGNVGLDGLISGPGDLVLETFHRSFGGNPRPVFELGSSNTYAGSTLVRSTGNNNGYIRSYALNALPTTSVLTLDSTPTGSGRRAGYDLNGNDQEIAGLVCNDTGQAISLITNSSATYVTLTVNNNADHVFQGVLGQRQGAYAVSGGLVRGDNLGLTKKGSGSLTIDATKMLSNSGIVGEHLYTGDTKVLGGTLKITSADLPDGADVYLTTGAVLDLAFGETDTIRTLYIEGAPQEIGTVGPIGSGADLETALLAGTGQINATEGGSTSIEPVITSITVNRPTATITMVGAANTTYVCRSSLDLLGDPNTWPSILTDPSPLVSDASGEATFTVDATEARKFYLIAE